MDINVPSLGLPSLRLGFDFKSDFQTMPRGGSRPNAGRKRNPDKQLHRNTAEQDAQELLEESLNILTENLQLIHAVTSYRSHRKSSGT
jgi:hypothetical protein